MDIELQRKEFQEHAIKIELLTDKHIFSIMLPWNYLENKNTLLPVWHNHTRYEILCLWDPADPASPGAFQIIPPFYWHESDHTNSREGMFLTTFQFSVKNRPAHTAEEGNSPNSSLEAFLRLPAPIELADTFDGTLYLEKIRKELENGENICGEVIYALFQLLMLELARRLPEYEPQKQPLAKYSVDDFRAEMIEIFFVRHHGDPDCGRHELAEVLCVSERQVMRIIEQLYGKSFREMLTEYRMEFAEGRRHWMGQSAEENAIASGYLSTRGFLDAYRQYHGRPYVEEKRHDR